MNWFAAIFATCATAYSIPSMTNRAIIDNWNRGSYALTTFRTPCDVYGVHLQDHHCNFWAQGSCGMINLQTRSFERLTRGWSCKKMYPLSIDFMYNGTVILSGVEESTDHRFKVTSSTGWEFEIPSGSYAFTGNEHYKLSLSTCNRLTLVDIRRMQKRLYEVPETCLCAALYENRSIFLGGLDGQIYYISLHDGRAIPISNFTSPSPIRSIQVMRSDGNLFSHVVMGCQDGSIRTMRWFAPEAELPIMPTYIRYAHQSPITQLCVNSDRTVVSTCDDGNVIIGNVTDTWHRVWWRVTNPRKVICNERFLLLHSEREIYVADFEKGLPDRSSTSGRSRGGVLHQVLM